MTIIDSTGVRQRAAAAVGSRFTPGGRCLEHNAFWALQGVTSPFGQAGRVARSAMDAWNWSEHKVTDGSEPFDGAWCFFGESPTRRDANKAAGDVTTYEKSSKTIIATDANGNVVGRMTIAQRAAQTQRPYLGHTGDYLGALASGALHTTSTSLAAAHATTTDTSSLPAAAFTNGGIMQLFRNNKTGEIDLVGVETGFWWRCPNMAYVNLCRKLFNTGPVQDLPENQWGFVRDLTKKVAR